MPPIKDNNVDDYKLAYWFALESLMKNIDPEDKKYLKKVEEAEKKAQKIALRKFGEIDDEGNPQDMATLKGITIRKDIALDDLQSVMDKAGMGEWRDLPDTVKDKALWQLGFDTKGFGHFEELRTHRKEGQTGEPKMSILIVSEERTDDEWIMKRDANGYRVASEEAQEANGRYGDKFDMGRLRGWKV